MGLFNFFRKKKRPESVEGERRGAYDATDDLLNPLNPISPLNPMWSSGPDTYEPGHGHAPDSDPGHDAGGGSDFGGSDSSSSDSGGGGGSSD